MSAGYFSPRSELYLDNLFHGLITASHILHKHNVFDAYGHISVRNPDNPSTFFMSSSLAPALVQSVDDIKEYKVEDGEPVEAFDVLHFAERYIHR
jgi:ribulose-5-phosphate 4-epimerase/fuculose-1-phosphate aldolase